jgi:hypothetical protein
MLNGLLRSRIQHGSTTRSWASGSNRYALILFVVVIIIPHDCRCELHNLWYGLCSNTNLAVAIQVDEELLAQQQQAYVVPGVNEADTVQAQQKKRKQEEQSAQANAVSFHNLQLANSCLQTHAHSTNTLVCRSLVRRNPKKRRKNSPRLSERIPPST